MRRKCVRRRRRIYRLLTQSDMCVFRQGILRVALLARVQTPRRGKKVGPFRPQRRIRSGHYPFPCNPGSTAMRCLSQHTRLPIAPLRKVARDPLGNDKQSRSAKATQEISVRMVIKRYGSTVGARREEGSRIGSVRNRERVELRGVDDRRCASCASREAGLSSPLFWQLSRAHARV